MMLPPIRPRTKGKYPADFSLDDSYKFYKKNVIKELQKDKKLYSKIIKSYFKKYVEALLTTKEPIRLDWKMGEIDIRKYKPKLDKILEGKNVHKLIDFKLSREHGKIIHYTNEHRDGYKYAFAWINRNQFKNKTRYSFYPIRKNSRLLSLVLKKYNKSQIDWPERK